MFELFLAIVIFMLAMKLPSQSSYFQLKQGLDPYFSCFFQKRNTYTTIYVVFQILFVLILVIFINIVSVVDDFDLQIQYLIMVVLGYLILNLALLPIYFKIKLYSTVCQIITYSEILEKPVEKRAALLRKFCFQNQIDISDIEDNLMHYQTCLRKIINHQVFSFEKEINSWIKQHKSDFNTVQILQLQAVNQVIEKLLRDFLKNAIRFCDDYNKNLSSGKYKEPYIPPMFFDGDDVDEFRRVSHDYKIGA